MTSPPAGVMSAITRDGSSPKRRVRTEPSAITNWVPPVCKARHETPAPQALTSPSFRRFPLKALPQDVQQVDQKLVRPLLLDQLGAGPDPGRILDQPGEGADAGVDRVDEDALDGLWR